MIGRRAVLAAIGSGALALRCRPAPPPPASPFLAELLSLAGVPPGAERDARVRAVDALLDKARQQTGDPAGALARALFDDLGFEREVDDRSPRTILLPPVLDARRGGCVGLGTLYLAAAERWGVPAHGVLAPGHFFVRAPGPDGRARNVELLRRGEEMPADWYRTKYGLPPGDAPVAPAYLRDLHPREVLAVLRFNLGNDLRIGGAVARAAALYAQAAADFPDFAEAHASLGLARQLLGDLDGARAAYAQARRVHPTLPGIDQNLAALERERAAAPALTSRDARLSPEGSP